MIITIADPGKNLGEPASYRRSLLKILERLILVRLQKETENVQLIPPEQFVFQKWYNTTLQVLRFVENFYQSCQQWDITTVTYPNVSKALEEV